MAMETHAVEEITRRLKSVVNDCNKLLDNGKDVYDGITEIKNKTQRIIDDFELDDFELD